MADTSDIHEIDPVLELMLSPCSLECSGTLNVETRHHVLEAVEMVLDGKPLSLDIDVSRLLVADTDGANALVAVQRMVREAGVTLLWQGLDAEKMRAVLS